MITTLAGDQCGIMLVTKMLTKNVKSPNMDYSQEKIIIKLPSATWDCYQTLDESHGNILHSSMAFPTLVEDKSH